MGSPLPTYNKEMKRILLRSCGLAGLFLVCAWLLCAQDWKTSESLPRVDLAGLTASQKATALKLLRERDCSCACGMKVAQCRMADPSCSFSTGLAQVIVAAIKDGK